MPAPGKPGRDGADEGKKYSAQNLPRFSHFSTVIQIILGRTLIARENQCLIMETDEAQECQVKKDLANLTRTLTSENLNPAEMFSKKRNIRSCTPVKEPKQEGGTVSERLKRVQVPEQE